MAVSDSVKTISFVLKACSFILNVRLNASGEPPSFGGLFVEPNVARSLLFNKADQGNQSQAPKSQRLGNEMARTTMRAMQNVK